MLGASVLLMPALAYAQTFDVWCGNLPGCGPGWTDFSIAVLNFIANKLPDYALALGILFLLVGAMYLLLNLGDEGRTETGKKTVMWSLGGIMIALFAQEFITFLRGETFRDTVSQNGNVIFQNNADVVIQIIFAFTRILRTFFNIALLVAIVFNALRMVLSRGADEEFAKAKRGLLWAAAGAVLINIAGRLVAATVGLPI